MQYSLDKNSVKSAILAGNAIFTIQFKIELETYRFTYRVSQCKDKSKNDLYFVSVLAGVNNLSDYSYIGLLNVFPDNQYSFRTTKNSKVGEDAKSYKTFVWLVSHWLVNDRNGTEVKIPVDFYHLGHCMRCGRALTVPESVKNGLGPECSKKLNKI